MPKHTTARLFLVHWALSAALPAILSTSESWAESSFQPDGSPPPNIVLIVTDNHGQWTLGCYGNPDIQTPNLDKMANDGVLFTNAFSNNPVCSPTRATLLTGLMPSQHGVHNYLTAEYNTLEEFDSLPEILTQAGYRCGIIGKWHLGPFDQAGQECFDYWVVKRGGHTPSFYNTLVADHTGKKQTIEGHITPFWTEQAARFLRQHKETPFFLYLAYNGPYGLQTCIRGEPKNRHAATYAGNAMESYPREPMHPWLRSNREHIGNVSSMRNYASQVSLVDDGVGHIIATLKQLQLDDNTIVVFTADQGMAGGHGGLWGMGDHTRPRSIFDPTLHIPLIVRHPGKIAGGRTLNHLVSNYDLLPSLLHYIKLGDKIPAQPRGPGRDFSPLLRGEPIDWQDVVFAEYADSIRMIRTDHWKYVKRADEGPPQLFDIQADPGEKTNLYGAGQYADILASFDRQLDQFFTRYSTARWNMWQPGGTSKHLHTKERPPALPKSGSR